MARLASVFLLLLMLVSAFLLPVASKADDCPISVSICTETLPVTEITAKSAVFTGKFRETLRAKFLSQNDFGPVFPWAFEYGIKPGVYPYRANALIDTTTSKVTFDGDYLVLQVVFTFKGAVQNLDPCQTYYVRFILDYNIWSVSPCSTVCAPNVVKFATTGCMIKTLGQGGLSSNPGTSPSLSSLPVSAPVQMASVVVQSAAIATTKVSPGQDVDIAASVTNKGTANGDAKLTLYVNGEAVESKGVTVASGQTVPVRFNVSRNEPGTYDVYVNGTPAGSFAVDIFTNNDHLIYFIMALFVMGIAGTVYLMMRKKTA